MTRPFLLLFLAGAVLATPALARDRYDRGDAPRADWNSHWLDYKTDLSEARRELRKDLRHASDRSDRVEAYAEYEREVADARHDYEKEMVERGYRTRRGSVRLEEW